MKIYHSLAQVFASAITAVVTMDGDPEAGSPAAIVHTADESIAVDADWLAAHEPVAGSYIVIGAKGATVMTEPELLAMYAPIGERNLVSPIRLADMPALVLPRRFTFDQFVQYGVDNGGNIVGGMPWSFTFHGHPVSHENNDCYIIANGTADGLRFNRADVLVLANNGTLSIEKGAA